MTLQVVALMAVDGFSQWFSLMAFAFVMSITPGPNNLMLMASGGNFGAKRSIPHVLGVTFGHSFMILLLGLGFMGVINEFPEFLTVVRWLGAAYLCYLAYQLFGFRMSNTPTHNLGQEARPMTFVQATLFQWVNPKGWAMAVTALSLFVQEHTIMNVVAVSVVFACTNFPCITLWMLVGVKIRQWLKTESSIKRFNLVMITLLIGSLATLWIE